MYHRASKNPERPYHQNKVSDIATKLSRLQTHSFIIVCVQNPEGKNSIPCSRTKSTFVLISFCTFVRENALGNIEPLKGHRRAIKCLAPRLQTTKDV